jgi:hypothetical protein
MGPTVGPNRKVQVTLWAPQSDRIPKTKFGAPAANKAAKRLKPTFEYLKIPPKHRLQAASH